MPQVKRPVRRPMRVAPARPAPRSKAPIPTGVKVISILNYVGAAFNLVLGILLLLGAILVGSLADEVQILQILGAGFFLIGAIIAIGFAVLSFFIGFGLWKSKNWARVLAIILSVIGIFTSALSIANGQFFSIIFLVINGIIGYYLWFANEVKRSFL